MLKHRAPNGGISVNPGRNTVPIKALMPSADHTVCLSLPSGSKTGPRGNSNDPLFHKDAAATLLLGDGSMK